MARAWLASLGAFLAVTLLIVTAAEEKQLLPVRFTEHLIANDYGYAYGLAAADLDGDGRIDFTSADAVSGKGPIASDPGRLLWYRNEGNGRFTPYVIQAGEPGLFERHAIGDINGDGKLDVVVVKNLTGQLLWFENNGTPRDGKPWKRHVITTDLKRAYDVALADLDGDGHLDVVASSYVGNLFAWFRNPGKATDQQWARHVIDENLRDTRTIAVADFNGDGKPDVLGTARGEGLVAWYENSGQPAGAWKRHIVDKQSPTPCHGHPVDMDGDGDLDVVMALGFLAPPAAQQTNQVVWYENVGKPGKGTEWKKHVIGALPMAFEAIAADLNGDGKPDVIATAWGKDGKVVWFENPGDPRRTPWKMHVLKDKWPNANQVIAADLAGNKRLDIIGSAERGANEVRWWRNDGPRK